MAVMTAKQGGSPFFSACNPLFIALLYFDVRQLFRAGTLLDAIEKKDFAFVADRGTEQMLVHIGRNGQMVQLSCLF